MPLRQSILSFADSMASVHTSKTSRPSKTRPTPSRTATSTTDASDTIVVETPERPPQLPTPSESATDVSSQGTDMPSIKNVPKGRGKRVSRSQAEDQSENCLPESAEEGQAKDRTVSGETLVNNANFSPSSIMEKSINLLNLPWAMSEVFHTGSKAELIKQIDAQPGASRDTLDTVTAKDEHENDDAEQGRREKAAAKKAKMEENKKTREEKWKAEDDKASRRSARSSMLSKANDLVSGITSSVLGKRKDRVAELRGSGRSRPQSAIEPFSAEESLSGPDAKRRRVSDSAVPTSTKETTVAMIRRTIRPPKDKKWLSTGLYVGQPRTFNPKVSESKNKRKPTSTTTMSEKENHVLPLPMFAGDRLLTSGRDFKLPFEVFSPLPPGQPKPDEWRKDNKNRFVGDASQEWRISKFVEHSTCMCKADTGCDSDCMNRFMYYECDARNCNLSAEQCGNRAFEGLRQRAKKGGKYNVGVEVLRTADRGNGVRANRCFGPNQIIVEYTGEIVTQEECERRMHSIYKENESYYLMLFDQNMIIDATTRGSIARFVNHSCAPNCRMEKWTVSGQPRMALFAGDRGVMTGEELTYDYNFDPYSLKNVQECRCGEKGCRGVLGPKPKEEKKVPEEGKEGKLKGVKRKIVEVVEEHMPNKKQKVGAKEVKTSTKSPRSSVSPRKAAGGESGKVKLMKKKPRNRRSITPEALSVGLQRNPSVLRKMLSGAKSRAVVAKERAAGRRVVSVASAGEALIDKENDDGSSGAKGKGVKRGVSLKSNVGSLSAGVKRSVRR